MPVRAVKADLVKAFKAEFLEYQIDSAVFEILNMFGQILPDEGNCGFFRARAMQPNGNFAVGHDGIVITANVACFEFRESKPAVKIQGLLNVAGRNTQFEKVIRGCHNIRAAYCISDRQRNRRRTMPERRGISVTSMASHMEIGNKCPAYVQIAAVRITNIYNVWKNKANNGCKI